MRLAIVSFPGRTTSKMTELIQETDAMIALGLDPNNLDCESHKECITVSKLILT